MLGRFGVRGRTTLLAMAVFAVAGAAAGWLLIWLLEGSLRSEVDRSIESRATDIAAQVLSENELIVLGAGIGADTYASVFSADGSIYDETDVDVDVGAVLDAIPAFGVPYDTELVGSTIAGADNMRAVALVVSFDDYANQTDVRFATARRVVELGEDDYVIAVATSLDSVDRAVADARRGVTIVGPALTAMVGVLTWLLAGRSLRPVVAIRREVDDITASDLHRRVPEPSSRDEVARLAATMNGMLDRLEESAKHQRQFVSDASHELRSPLASMQARLDVALRHGDETTWQATAADLRSDVARMHRLVEDLLSLARADTGELAAMSTRRELVDIDDVVFELVARAVAGDTTIDTSAVSAGLVLGDRDALVRVLQNLLDNAVRHARSRVAIAVAERDAHVIVLVDDDGDGIPADARERVFERFVRLDDARSRDSGGSGLGLAISRELAHREGGTLRVSDSALGGARFELVLPAAPTG